MKLAFILFDGMTALDFIGVYDAVTRLKTMGFMKELEWDLCSLNAEVTDFTGLKIIPTKIGGTLHTYDMIIVPGGFATRQLMHDQTFIQWLKTMNDGSLKVSVCTGSLLLGAAGFLKEKSATTHPNAFAQLEEYCLCVSNQRIVEDGEVITARGVTSSIDLGLYLCEKLGGEKVRKKIEKQMDYINRFFNEENDKNKSRII